MNTLILIQRTGDGYAYANPEVLGTFDNFQAVNRFIQTSTDYELGDGTKPKFTTCKQICYSPVGGTPYQLELINVQHNPYNRIGELADIISEEPTILDFEKRSENQPAFLAHQKNGYAVHPYFSKNKLKLQFWGWAIVLKEDGTWFMEATDGA
jgi:hypothetical protein